jgi:NTP pyrophosphatase (non-canonical NTP hydrolase)
MSIDEYVEWARNVGPIQTTPEATEGHLALLGLGLISDAGEVADLLKKRLSGENLDGEHLAYELGDVLYYWARLCAVTGVTPSELLDRSRSNIEARRAKRSQTDPATRR